MSNPVQFINFFVDFIAVLCALGSKKMSILVQFLNLPNCSFFRSQFTFVDLYSEFPSRSSLQSIPRPRPLPERPKLVGGFLVFGQANAAVPWAPILKL